MLFVMVLLLSSTGGFSTKNASISSFQSNSIEWVCTLFMLIGGANFFLHYKFFTTGNIKVFLKNREFVVYFLIIAICCLLLTSLMINYIPNIHDRLRTTLLQIVSIITSTGFVIDDFEIWPYFAQSLLFTLFFIGGCGGSTAGGIKVIRIYILFQVAFIQVIKVLHIQGVYTTKVGKTTITEETIGRIIGFFIIYLMILAIGSLVISFLGHDMLTAFSAVATSLGNIGPGFGEVGAMDNFSNIHETGKWVLIFIMIVGRLELFTVLVLFSKQFWRK